MEGIAQSSKTEQNNTEAKTRPTLAATAESAGTRFVHEKDFHAKIKSSKDIVHPITESPGNAPGEEITPPERLRLPQPSNTRHSKSREPKIDHPKTYRKRVQNKIPHEFRRPIRETCRNPSSIWMGTMVVERAPRKSEHSCSSADIYSTANLDPFLLFSHYFSRPPSFLTRLRCSQLRRGWYF